MKPNAQTLTVVAVLFATLVCGCTPPLFELQLQENQGLIWMFPGVEGGPRTLSEARRALRDMGVGGRIRTHDYGRPFGMLANLMAYEGNREAAAHIATQIVEYRVKHPNTTIDLVGYSGGGGMAVMVAEALPEDVRLRNVVLCQPAISPTYNLSDALRRIDGKLVNLYAPNDWFMLGWGTCVFGTMDRQFVAAAGKDGFTEPLVLDDLKLAGHFVQQKWTPDLITKGHGGMHMGILSYGWNRNTVAPWLVADGGEANGPSE
jgi:pimeloyl-ACP methyl ester carboxylesterase